MSANQPTVKHEEWRAVPGYEGIYQASNLGRIKRLARTYYTRGRYGQARRVVSEKIIQQSRHHSGYLSVGLTRDGKTRHRFAHCWILEAFLGPKPAGMQCRHFPDRTRTNNRIDNIRWDTQSENMRDKKRHGTFRGRHGPHRPESLAKMRAAKLGKMASAETRAKISAAGKGRKNSERQRDALIAANRARIYTPEIRARMSAARKGIKPSAEARAKMSKSGKGRKQSAAHRAKIAASFLETMQNRLARGLPLMPNHPNPPPKSARRRKTTLSPARD